MIGASIWKRIGAYRVWWGTFRKRIYLEDAGIDERII
jgi:hypothetical protein